MFAACAAKPAPPAPEVTDALAYVDPTIGTGGLGYSYGSCFVGAAAPHGLVKLGPDTDGPFGTLEFQHYSGYFSEDNRIQGFSHVHLHGAGATDYGILSVMPTLAFDPAKTSVVDYEASFAKTDEHAAAGRYEVTLDSQIHVVFAATQRAAVHRYDFPAAGAIVVDLAKTLTGGMIDAASIAVSTTEISGELHHVGGMSGGFGGYTMYFVMHGDVPFTSTWAWSATTPPSQTATTASGTGVGAALVVPAGTFQLAVGISLVSLAGARANLTAEVSTIDVDAVTATTQAAWSDKLDRVLLTGGTDEQRRIFYTSLYHAFLMPSVIDDVDGSYQLAGQPVAMATGYHQMSDLSLWDTYRTVDTLYAWLAPESAHDTARSLVGFGNGLGFYPRWPLAIGETGVMLGASAEIAVADAVARGVADAGGDVAYPLLRDAAMDATAPAGGRGGRDSVAPYLTLGYVPIGTGSRTASTTTEYAADDFALAHLAAAEGDTANHDALITRSHGYRQLFDASVGFLRAKNADGTFPIAAYDPLAMADDYAEANGWQSLWMTGLDDPDGLATLLGGPDAAAAKLESFFEMSKTDWDAGDPAAANVPRPYYWHGNEPDLDAVFLFALFGRPDLTDQWLQWIEDNMYTDQPDGVAGNDDGGTEGSWYVLATLGLYPIPGSDGWVIAAPRFPKARITVAGHELAIVADGSGAYVSSVDLDGVPVTTPTITQAQLAAATTLHFVMADSP